MELKELTEKTLTLFNSKNTTELIQKLPGYWNDNDVKAEFKELVDDLSIDWLKRSFSIMKLIVKIRNRIILQHR